MTDGDWAEARTVAAAFYVPGKGTAAGDRTVVWVNGSDAPVEVSLPEARTNFVWRRAIDSAEDDSRPASLRTLMPRSVAIFVEEARELGRG
jgi:hypothetical protein